jgi:hypothetical protein
MNADLWDVAPCGYSSPCYWFSTDSVTTKFSTRSSLYLLLCLAYYSTMKMEAVRYSETLEKLYHTTQCSTSEDCIFGWTCVMCLLVHFNEQTGCLDLDHAYPEQMQPYVALRLPNL